MEDKIQTSVWIRKDLYVRMKTEDLNFTKWVNEGLETYFEMNRKDEILKRLSEIDAESKTLRERLKGLAEQESQSMTGKLESDVIFEQMFEVFCKRREQMDDNPEYEIQWIHSPKNQQRCAIIGMSEEEVLEMLRNAYNHMEED